MLRRARYLFLALSFLVALPTAAAAQSVLQPSPKPLLTANNEDWYVSGEPIVWSGGTFYRAGAYVFFNGNQMVRAGSYHGIPLYVDATGDPNVVYAPLDGGLMQPYERRREGELAGTVGMQPPSFPVQTTGELQLDASRASAWEAIERATRGQPPQEPDREVSEPDESPAPPPTGTTGTSAARPSAAPNGVTGIWVDFDGHRWFSAGPAVLLDGNFTRIGRIHGFPVYRRDHDASTVYLAGRDGRVAPYSRRKM